MEVKNTTLREESSYGLKEKEVLMWNMTLLLPLLPNGNWSHFDTYCKDDIKDEVSLEFVILFKFQLNRWNVTISSSFTRALFSFKYGKVFTSNLLQE